MQISNARYPWDLFLCIGWSIALVPIAMLGMSTVLRTILGLPFLLFIPGYILVYALFPTRSTTRGLQGIERIALSVGLSIAVVPLLGLMLNYTPWGIRLEPILLSLFFFIIGIGAIGLYRWFRTSPDERFTFSFHFSRPQTTSRIDALLTTLLVICILIAVVALIYVIMTPKIGETFTEFYLLGSSGKATGYPQNLTVGENASVIIGIANHEARTINYTVEIWLIDQSIQQNVSTGENETVYHHFWFLDRVPVTLNSTMVDTEQPWTVQWEYNYTFQLQRNGTFKLAFLLYITPQESYILDGDYQAIAAEKIDQAYRQLHLWITVHF